jgi:tryptophan synthase alpha chain
MNRINQKLQEDKKLLSIYFTAGYPKPEDTVSIIQELEKNGVDMIEIGLPFSDPLADGPTIQESSTAALKAGMTTNKLFEQLKGIRETVSIPLLIMGYFNPILQYGVERFCKQCKEAGIDGLIIPDLPVDVYSENYKEIFEKYGLEKRLPYHPSDFRRTGAIYRFCLRRVHLYGEQCECYGRHFRFWRGNQKVFQEDI